MAQSIYSGELNTGIRSGEVRAPYPAVLVDGGICHLMGFASLDEALKVRSENESFTDFLAFEFQDGCWRPEGWTPTVEPVQETTTVEPAPPIPIAVEPEPVQESVVAPEMFNAREPVEPAVEEPTSESAGAEDEKIVKPAIFNVEDPPPAKEEPILKDVESPSPPKSDPVTGDELFASSPAPAKKKAKRSRSRKPRKPKSPPSGEG